MQIAPVFYSSRKASAGCTRMACRAGNQMPMSIIKAIKKQVAKQETAPATPAVATPATPSVQPQASHPFHIIVAGGIGLKDAEAMAEQLKAKGFAEAKALNSDGKIRVSIRSFENREEATRQLLELRKNETYKNAWLLAK